ncbi:MAG TPA: 50S ribosomal protein L11 methyltransferase [Bdellovibrionales bacterium]|nr:50S ribosomal protein L11 methyltransferase [Bdellovibrionales bacterium]
MSATQGRYFRLKVLGLPRKFEDEFTSACFEIGAAGVAEDLPFIQKDLRYDPDVLETPQLDANVYFESAPSEATLLQLQSAFPQARYEFSSEENKDWLEEWKKGFKPFLFAAPFWVIPSWLKAPPEAPTNKAHLIYVEPGMAFGTGTHETTRLAAGFVIEEVLRSKPKSVLDVGTGTGILALVARRLGVEKVVGIDNDPEARRTCRENLERNEASDIAVPDTQIGDVEEQYDVVIANIIDGVLTMLQHDLKKALKPGGRMILSGVLTDRETEFYANFTRETGLKLLEKRIDGEWSAAILG